MRFAAMLFQAAPPLLRSTYSAPYRDGQVRSTAAAADAVEGLGFGVLAVRIRAQPSPLPTSVLQAGSEAAVAGGSRLAEQVKAHPVEQGALLLRQQLQMQLAAQTCILDSAAHGCAGRDSRAPVLPQQEPPLPCGEPCRLDSLHVKSAAAFMLGELNEGYPGPREQCLGEARQQSATANVLVMRRNGLRSNRPQTAPFSPFPSTCICALVSSQHLGAHSNPVLH